MIPPLVPAAALVWAGAVCAILVADAAPWVAAALWVAAAATLLVRVRFRRGGLAVVALSLAATAATSVAAAAPARSAAAAFAVEGGRAVELVVQVTSKVEGTEDSGWFDADAVEIRAGPRVASLAVPVAVRRVSSPPPELDLGATVVVRGTAMPADAGERAVLVVFADRGLEVVRPPPGLLAAAAVWRDGFVATTASLPDPGGGLLPGLAVGDTRTVDAELDAAMKATSLSHLTAVSGANCAIVVGVVFAMLALCGARRGIRIVGALVALGGFVLLVTPEPSVVRAGAMAAIAMLALALGRRVQGLAVLALTVVVVLIADPWLALSLGFALSTAATASLLILAPVLSRGLARWMPAPLALVLAVPLAAQLACGPLLILVEPSVPVYSVVANLLAAPAAPAATVVGLLACIAAPWPGLAATLAAVAWLPATWIAQTGMTLAALPGRSIPWLEGWPGAGVLAALSAGLVALVARAGSTRPGDRVGRGVAAVATVVALGVVGGTAVVSGPVGLSAAPRDWAIAACDVGQGDAVVIRSAGQVALIDTGPDPEPLTTCLARLGIDRVDLLVLTHFDLDHRGGVPAVVGRVDTVVHGPTGPEDEATVATLREGGARTVPAQPGMSGAIGDARWRVLWPRGDAVTGNDASVILDIRGGGVPASVYLGDLSAAGQSGLGAAGGLEPPYAVVKVAHHGSADQDPGLYRRLGATLGVVSVGAENDYGHPRAEALRMLEAAGTKVARTDLSGLILIASDGDSLRVWREHAEVGVAPDG